MIRASPAVERYCALEANIKRRHFNVLSERHWSNLDDGRVIPNHLKHGINNLAVFSAAMNRGMRSGNPSARSSSSYHPTLHDPKVFRSTQKLCNCKSRSWTCQLSALPPSSSSKPTNPETRAVDASLAPVKSSLETQGPASATDGSHDNHSSTGESSTSIGAPATTPSNVTPPTPWLDALVPIPGSGGYKTRRRDILKLLPLTVAASCLAVIATRGKAFSYTSPAAILAAFITPPSGPDSESPSSSATTRVDAYVRYIAGIEKKGGGPEVPDFQRYGDWINSGPLSMAKELKGKVGL